MSSVYLQEDRVATRKRISQLNDLALEAQRMAQRGTSLPEQMATAVATITQTTEINQQIDRLASLSEEIRKNHLARLKPLAPNDFNAFCEYVNPDEAPASAWHIWLTEKLQEIEFNPDLCRFILNCPPGHAKPLHVDTPVLMANGMSKRLGDVVVGDEVITDKGRARRVSAVHEQGTLPLLKITTKKGRVVHSAYDHSFRVTKNLERDWVKAEDLRPGDMLQIVGGLKKADQFKEKPSRKLEVVNLTALFTSLGTTLNKENKFRIWANEAQTPVTIDILEAAGIKYKYKWTPSNKRNLFALSKASLKSHYSYLYVGEYMADRVIPQWIFRASEDKIKSYLTVVFNLKGIIVRKGANFAVRMGFANMRHAVGIQRLLARLNIDSLIKSTADEKRINIFVSGHDLADMLKLGIPVKDLDYEDIRPQASRKTIFQEDEVVSVEPIDAGECRCLTVTEDHTFLANNIVVHNSTYASRLFVAWRLGRNPNLKIIGGGHSQRFVENEFSAKIRNLVKSVEYRDVFPGMAIAIDTAAKDQWAVAGKSGQYAAKGVGQAVHGFRANFVCVDDPYAKIEEAESAVQRAAVETWFTGDLGSRMLPGGKTFLIMTRFHEEDLTGYLLKQNEGLPDYDKWYHVEAPALCIDPETDILGRKLGDVLWDYYDHRYFKTKQIEWSFQRFSLVYQQNASAVSADNVSGNFEYFTYAPHQTPEAMKKAKEDGLVDKLGRPHPNPREYYRKIIVSVDTAAKDNQRADYTVVQTWAETIDRKFYLLRQTRKKALFNDMIAIIEQQAIKDGADMILIEDKGSGTSYIQNRGRTNFQRRQAPCPIVAFDPMGQSKSFRFDEISPLIVAGDVFVPKYAKWMDAFLKEVAQFPESAHDDQVDAMSQALKYLRGNKTRFGSKKIKKMG